jgi:O-antigen ligase
VNFDYYFHVNLEDAQRLFTRLIPGFLFLITLAISPGLSIDPINAPKFLILTVLGVISIGLVFPNLKLSTKMVRDRFVLILMVGLFISGLLVAFLTGETSWKEQFFGVYGRNTGFVTYISLAFIFLALVMFFSTELLSKSIMTLVVCGSLSSLYGLLQFLDLDPVGWSNPYSPIIGFLGNSNFQSSFIGMASVALFDRLFRYKASKFQKAIVIAGLLLNLFIVVKSDSQQGLLVFVLGTSIVFLGHLSRLANKIYCRSLTLVVVVLGILSSMGLLQKGPFAAVLYQPSVTFRGDYWRAGMRMFRENLLNGLGLDSYGSFYRQYRDSAATLRRGPEITTNAAHNVVIDLAANGGLFLVVPYILLMFFTIWLFIRALKVDSENKSALILVFSLWLCYQAQSLISINLVSLATWGWVFMGLSVGLSLYILREKVAAPEKMAKVKANSSTKEVSAGAIVFSFMCAILGTVVGILPLVGSATERSAIQSGSVEKVIEAAFKEPRDPDRMNNLAAILGNGGYPEEALKIAKATVQEFPTSFVAWRYITQINNAPPLDKEQALKKMRELDPLNQNLR